MSDNPLGELHRLIRNPDEELMYPDPTNAPEGAGRMMLRTTPAAERLVYWWDRLTVWLVTIRNSPLLWNADPETQRSVRAQIPTQSQRALLHLITALVDAKLIDRLKSLTNPHNIPGRQLAIDLLVRGVEIESDNPEHHMDDSRLRVMRERVVAMVADDDAHSARHALVYSLRAEVMGVKQPDTRANEPQHAPDFSWVKCHHGAFLFSAHQRAVVSALWDDWEKGGLGLGQRYLFETAGNDTTGRLRDLFKGHQAWGTLIVSVDGKKDMYKLDLPSKKKS